LYIELRLRREAKKKPEDLLLTHNDLVVIFETENESQLIDRFGQPGTKFVGEIRLTDGYGEHYLLLQPTHIELGNGDAREITPQKERKCQFQRRKSK